MTYIEQAKRFIELKGKCLFANGGVGGCNDCLMALFPNYSCFDKDELVKLSKEYIKNYMKLQKLKGIEVSHND